MLIPQDNSKSCLHPVLVSLLLMSAIACGGSDSQTQEQRGEGAAVPVTSVDRVGSATVVIGDHTFHFEPECTGGTMLLMGPGKRADGTPAYLSAMFDPEDPDGSDIDVWVGTDQMGGPAIENWIAGDTYGNSAGVTWEGDRNSVSASAPFSDRENQVYVDGKQVEVEGTLKATCP